MNTRAEIKKLERAYGKAKHLLRPDWLIANEKSDCKSTGFCYIATEALFYMIGGLDSGYKPVCASYEEGTHWWLEKNGRILDPTLTQYGSEQPPYHLGRRCGFLTGYRKPSRRAAELMRLANAL